MNTTDVITLEDTRRELRLNSAAFDDTLDLLISAVSERLDELCGPIVVRTVTESHQGGTGRILLRQTPVASVTTVREFTGTVEQVLVAETNATKSSNDFYLDGTTGILYRRTGGYATWFPGGAGNVVVEYVAGRFATTADVTAKFRMAARIMVKHFWRYEAGSGSQAFGANDEGLGAIATFAVPRSVLELLAGEVASTVTVG